MFKPQKIKDKISKEKKRKKILELEEQILELYCTSLQKPYKQKEIGVKHSKYWKKNITNPEFCNPAELCFRIEEERLSGKQKLWKIFASRPALQEMFREIL